MAFLSLLTQSAYAVVETSIFKVKVYRIWLYQSARCTGDHVKVLDLGGTRYREVDFLQNPVLGGAPVSASGDYGCVAIEIGKMATVNPTTTENGCVSGTDAEISLCPDDTPYQGLGESPSTCSAFNDKIVLYLTTNSGSAQTTAVRTTDVCNTITYGADVGYGGATEVCSPWVIPQEATLKTGVQLAAPLTISASTAKTIYMDPTGTLGDSAVAACIFEFLPKFGIR